MTAELLPSYHASELSDVGAADDLDLDINLRIFEKATPTCLLLKVTFIDKLCQL